MRDFGESLLVYRPPIDTRSVKAVMGRNPTATRRRR
jgi:nitrate reductase alpha subunit